MVDRDLVLRRLADLADLERFRDEVVAYIRAGAAGV
jgi:hypothetical protein